MPKQQSNRVRVFYNAHAYGDTSDRATLRGRVFKAESIDDAEALMAELRDAQACDGFSPHNTRRPYIGMIHFGHSEIVGERNV